MGYHLTIKRNGAAGPITESEFARASDEIAELRHDRVAGKAEYFRGEELRATLMLQDGAIWTSVAEPDVIRIMARLALMLHGHVWGDEGEWYSEDGQAHVDELRERDRLNALSRFKRRRAIWNAARLVIVAVVAYLIYRNQR